MGSRIILTIDIGNNATRIGLFEGENLLSAKRYPNNKLLGIKEWLPKRKLEAVIISSVLPEKNELLAHIIRGVYKLSPIFIDSTYLKGAYPQLGSDRVTSLIGGRELFGLPLCVIDFGTATTIDVLSTPGKYLGGMILPGPQLGLDALSSRTSLLPKIEIEADHIGAKRKSRFIGEVPLLGNSTQECIQSGAYWGELYRIEGLIEVVKKKFKSPLKLVVTGGLGEFFSKSLNLSYKPWLTLYGLNFIGLRRDAGLH